MCNRYVDYYNKNGLVPVDGEPEKEQETEKDYIKSDKIEDYKGGTKPFTRYLIITQNCTRKNIMETMKHY